MLYVEPDAYVMTLFVTSPLPADLRAKGASVQRPADHSENRRSSDVNLRSKYEAAPCYEGLSKECQLISLVLSLHNSSLNNGVIIFEKDQVDLILSKTDVDVYTICWNHVRNDGTLVA